MYCKNLFVHADQDLGFLQGKLSIPRKKCCERETHVSLNKVSEYVVFPTKTANWGFFSTVNKIIVIAQLFCGYRNSAELPRVKRSVTETIGTQTGRLSMSSNLSNSVLMNWDTNYPYDKFKPPQGYKLQPVNPEQNHVISREQLEDCGHLPHLIAQFKEKYISLSGSFHYSENYNHNTQWHSLCKY